MSSLKTAVATTKHAHADKHETAWAWAQELQLEYIPRTSARKVIPKLADAVIIFEKNNIKLITAEQELFFHPGMAKTRIAAIKNSTMDHLTTALNLQSGMKVLDCTMGLASDALVIAHCIGSGMVTALEKSPLISRIIEHGLRNYHFENAELQSAAQKITVLHADFNDFILQQPDNSFDAIYFDPMFTHTIDTSCNIKPLRLFADMGMPTTEIIQQALRVASGRVVIKQPVYSGCFNSLTPDFVYGGRYSRIKYLTWENKKHKDLP